jgi:hypothetical protein
MAKNWDFLVATDSRLIVLHDGGPLLELDVLRTPDTYHLAGIRRGTATSNFHAHWDNLPLDALAQLFRGSPECRRLPHHSKATQPSQRQLTGSPPLCLSTTDHRRPAGITLRRHGHENVQVRRGSEWIRFDGTWRVARGSTSLGHLPRTRTSRPQGQTISVAHHRRLADDPGPPRCL